MVQSVKLGRLFTSVLLLFVSLEGAELVGHVTDAAKHYGMFT